MEIGKFLKDFKEASDKQDHFAMMQATQNFFKKIHEAGRTDGELLGIYSMAQQLEVVGLDTRSIKNAVRSRVEAEYASWPTLWKSVAVGLNSLLASDGQPLIPLKP